MRTRAHQLAFAAIASMAIALHAGAQQRTVSVDFPVSAVVPPNCVVLLSALSFGTYDPLAANSTNHADAAADLILTCTKNARVTIELDRGQHAANGAPTRIMSGSGSELNYEIYRDAARTQVWGTGADALKFVSQGVARSQRLSVYGRIPAGQDVPAGTFGDLVTATVDF